MMKNCVPGILSTAVLLAVLLSLASCQSADVAQGQTGEPIAAPAELRPVSAPAQPSTEVAKPAGLRVFYCSHSLMWDTPDPVTELAKAYGIADHVMAGNSRMGFSTTLQHWQSDNQSKQALQGGKVDVFIMSPMELPDTGIEEFVKLGLEHNPKMNFYCQNNWTAFNADGQKQHQMGGGNRVSWDQTTVEMLKGLNTVHEKAFEDQFTKINAKYKADEKIGRDVIKIIPTSQAVTAIRIKIAEKEFPGLDRQSLLFADQIGHPAAPLITLNAYVHLATVYGVSPVGLPRPSVLKQANNSKWDDDFNKRLQELAWKIVQDYSEWDGVKVAANQ